MKTQHTPVALDMEFMALWDQYTSVKAQRDELLEAARRALEWIEAEDDHTKVPDFWTRAQMCRDAELATRAAIAKATR